MSIFTILSLVGKLMKDVAKWQSDLRQRNAVIYDHLEGQHPEFFAVGQKAATGSQKTRLVLQVQGSDGAWMADTIYPPDSLLVPPTERDRFTNFYFAGIQCAANNPKACPHPPRPKG